MLLTFKNPDNLEDQTLQNALLVSLYLTLFSKSSASEQNHIFMEYHDETFESSP